MLKREWKGWVMKGTRGFKLPSTRLDTATSSWWWVKRERWFREVGDVKFEKVENEITTDGVSVYFYPQSHFPTDLATVCLTVLHRRGLISTCAAPRVKECCGNLPAEEHILTVFTSTIIRQYTSLQGVTTRRK